MFGSPIFVCNAMIEIRNSPKKCIGWEDEEKLPLTSMEVQNGRTKQSTQKGAADASPSSRPCVVGSWPLLIASMLFFTMSLLIFFRNNLAAASPCVDSTVRQKNASDTTTFYQSPDVIYGHVHIAKTGGTSLNGNLSAHYERICGNKGYSYDSFEAIEKFKKSNHSIRDFRYGRTTVAQAVMDEIGYQDCDWISRETRKWDFWLQFQNWAIPTELHVPCRSPVDHLMSQCNWRQISFDCNKTGTGMINQIDRCMVYINERYNKKLNETFPVKCFDYGEMSKYMDFIGTKLQRKRIETDYAFRATNLPRHKENECIWDRRDLQELVERHLLEKYDYYSFCNQCIGSSNDLLASWTEPDRTGE